MEGGYPAKISEQFYEEGYSNNLDGMKRIYEENKPDNVGVIAATNLFNNACSLDNLEMAKWLYKIRPDLKVSSKEEYPFTYACANGNLEMAKWLLQIEPKIKISANNERAFYFACISNHVEIAKWLLKIKPDIKYYLDNDRIFKITCNKHSTNAINFLISLDPYRYEYDKKNKTCRVRTQKEIQNMKMRIPMLDYNLQGNPNKKGSVFSKLNQDMMKQITEYVPLYNSITPQKVTKGKRACKYGPRMANGKCPPKPKATTRKLRACKYGPRMADGKCPPKPKATTSKKLLGNPKP